MKPKPTQIVDAVITNQDRYLLVQTRKPKAYGRWSFPGGHVNPGEDHESAIRREIREELDVSITDLKVLKTSSASVRDETPDPITIEAKTYLIKVTGQINLDPVELMDLKWLTKAEIHLMKDQLRSPWILPVLDLLP